MMNSAKSRFNSAKPAAFSGWLAGAAIVSLLFPACTTVTQNQLPAAPPPDQEAQAALSPRAVITLLEEGNERYREGAMLERDWMKQVQQTAPAQYPIASIVYCIDSRVPIEVIFDQGLGTLFGVRLAGNIVNGDALGSLEYASRVAGTPLILVLGHTHCGAIKGAIHGVELGNLTGLLAKIRPAIEHVENETGSVTEHDADRVTELNVRNTMARIREQSPVLRSMIDDGIVDIRGAIYDIETGHVHLLED